MSFFNEENEEIAKEIVSRYPVARSALIPLLHLAQEQEGWITKSAMEQIAELTDEVKEHKAREDKIKADLKAKPIVQPVEQPPPPMVEVAEGDILEHPKLGECEIVELAGDERIVIRLSTGRIVELHRGIVDICLKLFGAFCSCSAQKTTLLCVCAYSRVGVLEEEAAC